MEPSTSLTIGVLALQGAFVEHIKLLREAAETLQLESHLNDATRDKAGPHTINHSTAHLNPSFRFQEIRTPAELSQCSALIIPGGESTSISLLAERSGLLEPLRQFVKVERRPVWGTCAGLILLAESANKTKSTGQELIGGLDVRVQRNYFGRQVESFEAELDLPFLGDESCFHSVFIRAPVVEKVLPVSSNRSNGEIDEDTIAAPSGKGSHAPVEILGRLPGSAKAVRDPSKTAEDLGEDGDIVVVKQGNVFGTAFHPELTGDSRIHAWWLREVVKAASSLPSGS